MIWRPKKNWLLKDNSRLYSILLVLKVVNFMADLEKFSLQELFPDDYTYEPQNRPLDNKQEQIRFRNLFWNMMSEFDERYAEDHM